jgi:hypothetical protein
VAGGDWRHVIDRNRDHAFRGRFSPFSLTVKAMASKATDAGSSPAGGNFQLNFCWHLKISSDIIAEVESDSTLPPITLSPVDCFNPPY